MVKFINKFFQIIKYISACCLGIAFLICAINSISRYLFSHVFVGSEEIVAYLVVCAGFSLFPVLEGMDDQLTIDFLMSTLKNPKLKMVFYIFRGILTVLACLVITYLGYRCMQTAVKFHTTSPTLSIPKVILYAVPSVGFFLASIAWIIKLVFNKGRPLK